MFDLCTLVLFKQRCCTLVGEVTNSEEQHSMPALDKIWKK